MATKKMTKKDYFNALRAIVADNEELTAFIDRELKLLARKSQNRSKKPTKTQLENEKLKADIMVALTEADTMLNIKELMAVCPSITKLSNQKITHLLTPLVEEGKLAKTYVKKVPYFSVA